MKGLYFWVGGDLDDGSIISKKISNQIHTFENEGYEITFIGVVNRRTPIENIKWFLPFCDNYTQHAMKHAFDRVNMENYDFIYIRMPTASPALVGMLDVIRKCNPQITVLLEVPTYPVIGERRGMKRIVDIYGKPSLGKLGKYVDRIITFSKDEVIWGIQTIRTVNCTDMTNITERKQFNKTDTVNVITVSSYDYWHGYDRFIEGLREYYSKPTGNKRIVNYYIVGEGVEIKKYRTLVENYGLTEHIYFCGKHFGDDLDRFYDVCDIALDSMGRHRSRIYYNSSLKGKEYCAKGLPIVSGVETELDSFRDYPYYMRVPADDSPVDIDAVLEFYETVYNGKTREEVCKAIRIFGMEHFDFSVGMKPIIKYLNEREQC